MKHHPAAHINPHMGYRAGAVIGSREKDNVAGLCLGGGNDSTPVSYTHLHRFGGLWLWLRGHFFGRFLTLFSKRQKVVCGNCIEEIDVLAGFLFVDHQIKHAFVCCGDGVELLSILVGCV